MKIKGILFINLVVIAILAFALSMAALGNWIQAYTGENWAVVIIIAITLFICSCLIYFIEI